MNAQGKQLVHLHDEHGKTKVGYNDKYKLALDVPLMYHHNLDSGKQVTPRQLLILGLPFSRKPTHHIRNIKSTGYTLIARRKRLMIAEQRFNKYTFVLPEKYQHETDAIDKI